MISEKARTRLRVALASADPQAMELTRDERRLFEIRDKIESLHLRCTDDGLRERREALVRLEAILVERVERQPTPV